MTGPNRPKTEFFSSLLEWVPSPTSSDGLATYCASASKTVQNAEPALARLEILLEERKHLEGTISRVNQASDLASQARRMIEARVPENFGNRGRLQDQIARYGRMLAGIDSIPLESPSRSDAEDLVARHERARSQRSAVEQALAGTKTEYAGFTALREKSLNLAQQLRQVAGELLKDSPAPDECPLCHTRFGPGELSTHMNRGVDQHLEALAQTLLGRIKDQESALHDARATELVYLRLREFSDRCGLGGNVSIGAALTQHAAAKRALADAQEHLAILDEEMQALEGQGLSHTEFQRVSSRLATLKHPLSASTPEAAANLMSNLAQSLTAAQAALDHQTRLVDEQEKTLQDILRTSFRGIEESRAAISQLKEKLAATQSIIDGLGSFLKSFPWPPSSSIAELVVAVRSVRTVASELRVTLGRERSSRTTQAESVRRKESLDRAATELTPKLIRFAAAHDTLQRLMRNDSLSSAMRTALRQNRAAIESIFSRIHSPAEFSGLGKRFDSLVRKEDGSEAGLREISTGQRTAFALSIFLAQNSQPTAAPPVMLIDDPIAHVDDLNSLSFLDYLREIAIREQRQIFFATANDKIASLFERKFDFLGEEDFQKFELSRERS